MHAFIILGNWNGASLYLIVHVCMWSIAVFRFNNMSALLAQRYCQWLRWTYDLCTVKNIEYNICMTILRDDTSSSITLLNSSWADVVTYSPPLLYAYNSHALVLSSQESNSRASGFVIWFGSIDQPGWMSTHIDMITFSSNNMGDTWSSGVGTLSECTTLCCDSSKYMLCISTFGLSSRIFVSPWLHGTCSSSGFGGASGVTS